MYISEQVELSTKNAKKIGGTCEPIKCLEGTDKQKVWEPLC